jgi:hypothetical protein
MTHHQFLPHVAMAQLRARNGGVARDMWVRGQRVLGGARRRVGVDEGQLRNDLHVQFLRGLLFPGVEVGSDLAHAAHHHRGHGVIRPKRAKVLAFKPKRSGRLVFAMEVRAVAGNPYLKDSLRLARR